VIGYLSVPSSFSSFGLSLCTRARAPSPPRTGSLRKKLRPATGPEMKMQCLLLRHQRRPQSQDFGTSIWRWSA